MSAPFSCSVVMLVENGESDFSTYLRDLHRLLEQLAVTHELVVAINGPSVFARRCLEPWPDDGPELRLVELTRKVPSGICLQTLLADCRGELLIICGSYRQIADEGLTSLLREVRSGAVDLALPWRRQRVDPAVNQWQSRLFNWLVRRLTGSPFHDLSSTLRVVRRQVLEETPLYGDLYRYLPLLARRRGFRVEELAVAHAQELGKVGYYGLREYVSRLVDLLAMRFNFGFARKPLRYFGPRGLLLAGAGLLCMTGALALRLTGTAALGDSPLLMVGLVLVLAGSGLWGVGLLGEIIAFSLGRKHKDYIVERILG